MRRAFLVALIAVAVGLTGLGTAAAQTPDQYPSLVLTATEVGSGFSVAQSGASRELTEAGIPNHAVAYQRIRGGIEIVAIAVTDAAASEGVDASAALNQALQLGLRITEATPPDIGINPMMATISGSVLGQRLSGDAVSWQQGSIRVTVVAIGTNAPTSLDYAYRQFEKIAAAGF